MIIQNGHIQIKHKTAGGIDKVTGHPIPSVSTWSVPIPCQYIPNNVNKRGMIQGEHYTIASYTILLEEQPFTAEQIRLTDMDGNVIGEYSIISSQPLDAVKEVQILV